MYLVSDLSKTFILEMNKRLRKISSQYHGLKITIFILVTHIIAFSKAVAIRAMGSQTERKSNCKEEPFYKYFCYCNYEVLFENSYCDYV